MTTSVRLPRSQSHVSMVRSCTFRALTIIPFFAFFYGNAMAQAPTMAEVLRVMAKYAQLPEYAKVKLTENEFSYTRGTHDVPAQFAAIRDKWEATIGKSNWVHFHHYCFGIVAFDKLRSITGESEEAKLWRKSTLERALQEFQYMEDRADSSFPLWSQLYTYEFQIYSRLGQPVMAQRVLRQLQELQKRLSARP